MPSRTKRISIRLSSQDASAILTGLNWILSRHQLWIDRKSLPNADPTRRMTANYDFGVFHQGLMEQLMSLRERVRSLKGGGRLYITDPFEAAQCALAARIAGWLNRHRHQSAWFSPKTKVPMALKRRLEAVRKRLKRALVGIEGSECYRELTGQWQSHLRWLRVNFCHCWCATRWQAGSGRYYRRQLAILIDRTRVGLAGQQRHVPEQELGRLVRLALRSVRRDRTSFSFRDLINDPELARSYLTDFVLSRFHRGQRRKLTTIQ
jgi:hypothetical protein